MNATIMKGERSKLLAVAIVIAMVACALVAFMPSVDAYDDTAVVEGQVNVGTAEDLAQAFNDGNVTKIVLTDDITGDFTVSRTVTIDLAGFTITNSADHTITVANGGNLTVNDSSENKTGTVDNITHAKGAIYINNGATVTLNGGTFERSMEASTSPTNNGGNSWYTIWNGGNLTINEGATVLNGNGSTTGFLSSIIRSQGTADSPATLTIKGATITGGLYIYNSDYSTLTITGGTITGTNSAVFNTSAVEITGGTFGVIEGADDSSVIWTSDYTGNTNDVSISISGATINGSIAEGVANDTKDEFGGNVAFVISADTTYDSFVILAGDTAEGTISTADGDITFSGITDVDITVADGKVEVSSLNVPTEGTFVVPETIEVVNNGVIVEGTSATVTTEQGLKDAIANDVITEITIDGEIQITSVVTVDREVTIIGSEGAKLVAVPNDGPYNGEYSEGTDKYVLNIIAGATVQNLIVDSDNAAFGINVWSGTVSLKDVSSVNSAGAGFVLGGSATVSVDGIISDGCAWGGMNVDGASVTFADAASFEGIGSVYSEDSQSSTIILPQGYDANVEMTGTWSDGNTNYIGYYNDIDDLVTNYNDNRLTKSGAVIAINADVELNTDLTIESGTKMTIPSDVTLSLADGVKLTINGSVEAPSGDDIGAISGGTIEYGKVNNDTIIWPDLEDGTIVIKDGHEYTVCHGQTSAGRIVQYGVAISAIVYDGSDKAGEYDELEATSLDNYFRSATNISGTIINPSEDVDACIDAGDYKMDVVILMTSPSGTVTRVTDTIDVTVQPTDPTVIVGIGGDDNAWFLDGFTESDNLNVSYEGITIDGTTYGLQDYLDAGGEFTYQFFVKNGDEYTLLPDINETNYMDLGIGNYRVTVTASAVQNYNEMTESVDFSVTPVEIAIDVTQSDETNIFGTPADRYMGKDYVVDNSNGFVLSGGIYWIDDINDYEGINTGDSMIFQGEETQGYYALFEITNKNTFDLILTFSTEEGAKEITVPAGASETIFKFLGDDITDIRNDGLIIHASAADSSRGVTPKDFAVSCAGLYRIATAGYNADATEAGTAINEEFTWNSGAGITDVAPETMWIAFDEKDVEAGATLTGKLYYVSNDGTEEPLTIVIGQSTLTATGTDERIWYFTMDETLGTYIGVPSTPGYYKLEICDENGKVIASANTFIEGMTGAGYEDSQDDAIAGMNGDGFPELGTSDISPETFWIAWYEGDALDGTFAAYLKDADGNILYTAPASDVANWNTTGYHYWAFSKADGFPDSIESLFDLAPGVYTLEVTLDGETYQTADVIVPGIVTGDYSETSDGAQTGMVDAGISEDVFTGNNTVADQTMWVVWYGQDYESVTATVTLPSGETWSQDHTDISAWLNAGIHSWYFSFDPENASYIGYEFEYGTYTIVIEADDQTFTYEMTFVDPTKYNVHINEWVTSYDDGNVRYDVNKVFGYGDVFYLPGTGFNDKTLDCWELVVDGVVVNTYDENAMIVFGDIKDENGVLVESHDLEFRAKYVTGSGGDEPGTEIVTDYNVSVNVDDENSITIITTPVSGNTADTGMHSYRIVVQSITFDEFGIPTTETVFEHTILSAINGTTVSENRSVDLPGTLADGYVINVYFETSAGSITAFLGSYAGVYDVPEEPVTGYYADSAAAADAIDAVFKENGRNDFDKDDVGEQTMFVTFDLNENLVGENLNATAVFVPADGSEQVTVHTEVLNFDVAGIHCWYFSFDPNNYSWIGAEIGVGEYTLSIVTDDGTSVVEVTVTISE